LPLSTYTIAGELDVHRIGYGGMALTGPGAWGDPPDRAAARALLCRAVELGVQLFDTADSYGPEVSERLLAEALHPYPEGVVVATKGGLIRTGPWELHPDGRPDHLRETCEGSLRRLRLERIDLYQLHGVDGAVPLEESMGALAELRAEGKIRHVGLSNVRVEQIEAARKIVPVVSVQNEYNVGERGSQDEVIEFCEREGIAYLPWRPLGKGSLARPHGALGKTAAKHGVTPAQIALAWLLARSPVIVPIPGTLSPAHVAHNVASLELELSPTDLAMLDSYRLSRLDARQLARRFVPPRLRKVAVAALRTVRRGSG
jgi:aryl-alcohol dehydrogenase-like predicted oxidoreductase